MLLYVEEATFFADLELDVLLHSYWQLDPFLETFCFCGFEGVESRQVIEEYHQFKTVEVL